MFVLVVGTLDEAIECKMSKSETGNFWLCLDCDYMHSHKTRVKFHVESNHIDSPGHMCEICQKICPSKNALNIHRSRFHKH